MYSRLVLNKLKVMRNFMSICAHWAPSSKKFFKKFPIYMWLMFTHVHPCVNYEWTKTQLKVNLNLIKSELKIN
jgi:hypothetical protein